MLARQTKKAWLDHPKKYTYSRFHGVKNSLWWVGKFVFLLSCQKFHEASFILDCQKFHKGIAAIFLFIFVLISIIFARIILFRTRHIVF